MQRFPVVSLLNFFTVQNWGTESIDKEIVFVVLFSWIITEYFTSQTVIANYFLLHTSGTLIFCSWACNCCLLRTPFIIALLSSFRNLVSLVSHSTFFLIFPLSFYQVFSQALILFSSEAKCPSRCSSVSFLLFFLFDSIRQYSRTFQNIEEYSRI